MAPALLCGLATNQLFLVETSNLSPWKGGGFGMFSTMDSPGARFVRVYLSTPTGDTPVMIPQSQHPASVKLRTMPNATDAQKLADELASGSWVKRPLQSAHDYYASLDDERARSDTEGGAGLGEAHQHTHEFVHMLSSGEVAGPRDTVVSFAHLRLEVWRYHFEPNQSQLLATQLFVVRSAKRLAKGQK